MKLIEFYKKAISIGIENDPRGKGFVEKLLKIENQKYNKLSSEEKEFFDKEALTNPFADTRLLYGKADTELKTIMVGIDIETQELVLADRLREKGEKIDAIIAHHPEGLGLKGLSKVMQMQADIFSSFGVPIRIAEGMLSERISEVERRVMPVNHNRAVDAARLLNIPLICTHTPADNCVVSYLQKKIDDANPFTVKDIMDIINEIPVYKDARKNSAGPKILAGSKDNRCGKIFVDMTGGTGGPKDIFKTLSASNVGTIIGMHIGEEHLKIAKENHINIVIAGHISSDTIGMNLLLKKVFEGKKVKIIECSGFNKYDL